MWQETNQNDPPSGAHMSDVSFRINCQSLLVDHAALLADATCTHAPIIRESMCAGIHPIHVAGSQNGWERPDNSGEYLLLSKRTRFKIRIENTYAQQLITTLSGITLDIANSPLHILSGISRVLQPASTLFSRYTYFEDLNTNDAESLFVERVVEQCKQHHFSPTKILCGKEHTINTTDGPRLTRSVLLADVPVIESLTLQDYGLGDGRTMGCGLLIPHKDTGAVHE